MNPRSERSAKRWWCSLFHYSLRSLFIIILYSVNTRCVCVRLCVFAWRCELLFRFAVRIYIRFYFVVAFSHIFDSDFLLVCCSSFLIFLAFAVLFPGLWIDLIDADATVCCVDHNCVHILIYFAILFCLCMLFHCQQICVFVCEVVYRSALRCNKMVTYNAIVTNYEWWNIQYNDDCSTAWWGDRHEQILNTEQHRDF